MSTPQNVCTDQKTFNKALQNAANYVEKKNTPDPWVQMLALGLLVIILVYAILLASKVVDVNDRVLHYTIAILFSPFYIIAHVLSMRA
jgi:hypothetical protein